MQKKVVKRTVAFSKDSSNLFFHILTKCNLRCKHCYINRDEHGRETLDLATIREWLALFIRRSQDTNLILLGGEPTLHPDLSLVVKTAREMGFSSITIDTNGYLFHDILDKITPDDLDFISFSLDGATPAINDAIRGKGCYDACVNGVKRAVEKGFSTSMIYTVSAANIDELDQMPDLVKDLGVDRFFIQVVGIRGESAGKGDTPQVTRKRWLEVVPKVARRIAQAGITVTWPKVFLDPDEAFECAGLVADNYFVFPNGRVYRCPLCEDHPIHGFEIRENQLVPTSLLNETALFDLTIPEGCVMNKLVQPGNITYRQDGKPEHKIACCMLKQEIVLSL